MPSPTWRRVLSLATMMASVAAAPAIAADFNGVWRNAAPTQTLRTVDGAAPPLLPAAAKVYEQHIADRKAGRLAFDPDAMCKAPGVPRIMLMGEPFQLLQTKKQVFMLFQWNRELRIVDLDIGHGAQNMYAPIWFGFSTGKVSGDTLSIDTTSYNDLTLLDDAGLPHSEDLHTVERYTLADGGKRMDALITVEDPKTYARPWSFKAQFVRLPDDTPLREDICVERNHLLDRKAKNPV